MKWWNFDKYEAALRSHPARGAWIEILPAPIARHMRCPVAPRKGCVD